MHSCLKKAAVQLSESTGAPPESCFIALIQYRKQQTEDAKKNAVKERRSLRYALINRQHKTIEDDHHHSPLVNWQQLALRMN